MLVISKEEVGRNDFVLQIWQDLDNEMYRSLGHVM